MSKPKQFISLNKVLCDFFNQYSVNYTSLEPPLVFLYVPQKCKICAAVYSNIDA